MRCCRRSRVAQGFLESPFEFLNSFLVITVIFLALGSEFASASTVTPSRSTASANCRVAEPNIDYSDDTHALDDYGRFTRHLLVQRRYEALDCIADAARANKIKFSGGFWKLHTVYIGLEKPVDGGAHATEKDWTDHIDRLKRWKSANPKSVTARIALAKAYVGYAWMARGEGYSDTVTDNGWKLIAERSHSAGEALKEAYRLSTKCPEWYVAMQQLLQLVGTDQGQLTALLQRAIAFEPTYQYVYRMHANLLAAKWYGEEGEEERFAEEAADRVGGTQGDILYFEITSHVICPCNDEVDLKLMSWPRMQKGYKALTEQSGPSFTNLNRLAYMAIKENDPAVADETFTRIGEHWDESLWKTRASFDENKKWASDGVKADAWEKSIRDAAEADMATPEGIEIRKKFDEQVSPRIQACVASSEPNERQPFELWVSLGEKGETIQVIAKPFSNLMQCIFKKGPETLLPPPHTPFWLRIQVDPGKLATASAR